MAPLSQVKVSQLNLISLVTKVINLGMDILTITYTVWNLSTIPPTAFTKGDMVGPSSWQSSKPHSLDTQGMVLGVKRSQHMRNPACRPWIKECSTQKFYCEPQWPGGSKVSGRHKKRWWLKTEDKHAKITVSDDFDLWGGDDERLL